MERRAFSLRQAEGFCNVSRRRLVAAIRSGELVAGRPGKRDYEVLARDVENWLRLQGPRATSPGARARLREQKRVEHSSGP